MVDIAAPPGTGWASDAGPYVQALRTVDGFRVEVSSNQFLDGDNQLTPDQEAALVTSGWEAPAPEPNSTSPNWWRDHVHRRCRARPNPRRLAHHSQIGCGQCRRPNRQSREFEGGARRT